MGDLLYYVLFNSFKSYSNDGRLIGGSFKNNILVFRYTLLIKTEDGLLLFCCLTSMVNI